MSQSQEPILNIVPFVRGVESRERVILRRADDPDYLCLTKPELAAVEDLIAHPVEVGEFLGRYLGGHKDLNFKAAISLLVRLHQAHFIADTTRELAQRLRETLGSGGLGGGLSKRTMSLARVVLDLPLVSFERSVVHPIFKKFGALLVSPATLTLCIVFLAGLAARSGARLLADAESLTADLAAPEALLLKAFLTFSLATSWVACLQMAALAGSGARFVGASLKLSALCVVRLAIDDTDVFMLPKGKMLRYQLFTLVSPWLSALLAWQFTGVPAVAATASLLAVAFALIGLALLCPLWRSPLVKIGEGYLATLGILEHANAYLRSGLFHAPFSRQASASARQTAGRPGDQAMQLWVTFFACVSIVWLYGVGLMFTDALLGAGADLWVHAVRLKPVVRSLASAFLLVIMALAVLLPFLRLIMIPLQNLASVASLPLRRARRGIGSFYDKSLSPSAAVSRFLREIPILADLSEAQLAELTARLKYRRSPSGQAIISKGESGEEFFILADGRAQVIIGSPGERQEVVDELGPGDSFGEIALVEKVRRTATIRAVTPCKLLVLERDAFDHMFPEGSEARSRLTTMIRQVKLVLESQALSHLAPRQIRELLRHCRTMTFADGNFLIRENTVGDEAYLIQSGEVQVVSEKSAQQLAVLGRGELVGAISLIKDIRRTASVRARGQVTALAIDKPAFLKMCMSNVFVALLVSELADRQISQTQKQAG